MKYFNHKINKAALLMVLLNAMLLVGISQAAENIVYYHNDALGSPVAATDQTGQVLWQEEYRPYGKRILKEANTSNASPWFTGKPEEESLGGIQYFGARWYHPDAGRFMGIDPVGFTESNPVSFNRYAYANNNPYGFVDPDGNFPIVPIILGVGAYLTTNNAQAPTSSSDLHSNMDTKTAEIASAILGVTSLTRLGSASLADDLAKSALPRHTKHSLNQKINRQVKASDELDAIRKPLDKRPVKYDNQGRPSQRNVGEKAEVAINPNTNKIVSVNPTSSKKAARLKRRNEQNQ